MTDGQVGWVDEGQNLPDGSLRASGGWCAPSQVLYEMGLGEHLTPEDLDNAPPPEPEPLPEVGVYHEHVEWVLCPSEDYYGIEETYPTKEAALAAYNKRISENDTTEAAWIEERHIRTVVGVAGHGTKPPYDGPPFGSFGSFVEIPTFPIAPTARGGIQFNHQRESNQ